MSGANKKKQGNVSFPVSYIAGFVLSLVVYTCGLHFRNSIPGAKIVSLLCLALLLGCTIASIAGSFLYRKALQSRSVACQNELADQRRERMGKDPKQEWAKLRNLCILGYSCVILYWALCLGTIFFYGASGLSTDWIILELIPMFFLMGLIGKLRKPKHQTDPLAPLPESEYPLMYGLVREAAGEKLKGRKLTIRVLDEIPDQECNAALALNHKEVCLWIGAVLLCILDEAEFRQVVYHEFAHMDKDDVSQNRMYNRIMGYLTADPNCILGGATELALSYITMLLYQEGQYYFLLSSRMKENKADNKAASQGDREKQASALAKICAHTLHIYENEPYVNIFKSEEIPLHLITDRAREFRKALSKRADFWKSILEREIPSRVDTHPTFRQRWEALDFCHYSLVPAQTDTPFAKECWAAAETADKDRAAVPKERYEAMRKESYLDDLKVIAEYESQTESCSPDELRTPMLAYYKTGAPDKMEAICDQILKEHESPFSTAFAAYWKGILLLRRYDKAGLNYLYRAMDANTNYIESGLEEIGRFCTMMGLQHELDEYRSRAPELLQLKVDRNVTGIHARAKLSNAVLPEGWLDKILRFIQDSAGSDLDAVYLVKELASEDYTPSSFVLRFREGTPPERMDDVYERVFRLLDDWPEDYEFCLYIYEESMEKVLDQVEGSCVYRQNR